MRVLPDSGRYVRGFVYEHGGERVPYLREEVVWFRLFNPLDEFSSMPAVAPVRLAVDMGTQALKFNRNFFSNSAIPGDLAVTTPDSPSDEEVTEFLERWDAKFRSVERAHRPVLLSGGMDIKRLGLSHRDMEFLDALRWTVDEVARAFGVPKAFLAQFEDATLANVEAQERFLWRNTVVPELRLLEDAVNRSLAPLFEEFQGQYRVQFDLSAIEALKESQNDRVDRLVKLVEAGVLSREEAREEAPGS
jgi:HK97 family phage portal protein